MKYASVLDESYKGYDITIYTHEDNTCTLDVKYPCGELIKGWTGLDDFERAISLARLYIYALGDCLRVTA